MNGKCQGCENESDYSAHGIRDGGIYSEEWCTECWAKRHRGQRHIDVEMTDDDLETICSAINEETEHRG